ncbi:hypothetical protein HY310_02305 [Candidatus Microgenomates bacterium]|nr:hypothetical protein [Candidatus Microgenomates bacterium]
MKRIAFYNLWFLFFLLLLPYHVFAVSTSSEITQYTSDTLSIITVIASAAAVFFLIKGGYLYMSSTGKPEAIIQAKKTIKNALIGLVIVLGASLIVSLFNGALNSTATGGSSPAVSITPIESVKPTGGLTQVLIDAVSGFMQNIVESATKPIVDGIIGYLTTTPSLLANKVIVNFWLVILGITDSLFAVIVALLGLHFMSASTFGYDDVELSQLLPKIGIAFLGANVSLFLADYAIITVNVLITTVINATGGLAHAWIVDAINPATFITGTTPLITLVFLILFLIISIVLLFMYIGRLIMISLGAVLSPFIFLLWIVPKFSDFAEIAAKSYVVSVFMVFIHVVIIQLASSFLSLPSTSGNSLVSIAVAIGLFLTLLKVPAILMQMVFYNSANHVMRKIGHEITNVMSTDNTSSATRQTAKNTAIKAPRKVVAA